jgi:L-fucose isomerase-like protein
MAVNIITFFSPVSPQERVSEITGKLNATQVRIFTPDSFFKEGVKEDKTIRGQNNYLFIGTGGTEEQVVQFISKSKISPPILLLSHEGSNSLPAAMEIRSYLEMQETPARIIHDSLENLTSRIQDWEKFTEVIARIHDSRIGVVGKASSWLMASDIDRSAVSKKWGVEFKNYSINTIIERKDDDLWEEFRPNLEQFLSNASNIECSNADIRQSAIIAQAVAALVRNHDLNAVTLECFKLLEDTEVSGCFATSHINTLEGIVAGCEGDLPTTFTMLLAKYLTNQPAFMANVVDVNVDNNSVVFAHCTVPTSILESYEITSHYESGKSVAIRGRFPFRDITVFKMFGKDLTSFWVSEGVITKNLSNEEQCRTQIRTTITDPVSYFLSSSLANHHVIIPGKHKRRIIDFFDFIQRQ